MLSWVVMAQETGGGFAALLLFGAIFAGMFWLIRKVLGPPPNAGPATGEDRGVLATPENTDSENPWLQRVFQMPAYGQVPAGIAQMMRQASAEGNERVFGAVATQHGRWKAGYLVATTDYLRFIQTRIAKGSEFYPYGWPVEKVSSVGARNVIVVGDYQFQIRGSRRAKEFMELHKTLIQALNWSGSREAEVQSAAAANAVTTSTAEELERLAQLHLSGAIDDDEFRQAKQRLLGG